MCMLSYEQEIRRVTVMPDALFAEPKLAEIYDLLDRPDRPDLAPYLAIVDEFHAHSVVDLGCGTGTLACREAALGKEVVGIDPAAQLKGWQADLITMTGNVAQVCVTGEEWMTTLRACREALRPSGRLVF